MSGARRPSTWKVLAVFCGSSEDTGCGAIQEFAELPVAEAEVHIVRFPSLQEVSQHIQSKRPNLLYLSSGIVITGHGSAITDITLKQLAFRADNGDSKAAEPGEIVETIGSAELDTVYIDAKFPRDQAEKLRAAAVRHVIHWREDQPAPALVAAVTGKAFFANLRNSTITSPEAFQLATHAAHVHCTGEKGGKQQPPLLPSIFTPDPLELPDNTTVPPPMIPHLDLSRGMLPAVPGWAHVRLLAPHADLRLLLSGQSTQVDVHRLSYLGEALRGLLVAEMRAANVISVHTPDKVPAYLPAGCESVKASLRSTSGGRVAVVLGGPPEVIKDQGLVEHALRHTLVADALALQVKLPPAGAPAPIARSSAAVAGGAPVVEVLVSSSLWAVHLLKALSQDPSYRGLVALGIGAVGGASVAAFNEGDAALQAAVIDAHLATPRPPPVVPLSAPMIPGTAAIPGPGCVPAMSAPVRPFAQRPAADAAAASGDDVDGGAAADGNDGAVVFPEWAAEPGSEAAAEPIVDWASLPARDSSGSPAPGIGGGKGSGKLAAAPRTSHKQPRLSARPPLAHCSEREFLDDVCTFLTERREKKLNPDTFPDAILNGVKLDLFALYKEVVSRGGFNLGNGINWKSQVFTQMRNWTPVNNMTGVGNALKKHYQAWLLEYEREHPEDVTGDSCALCGGGDEVATDWISCDSCGTWCHFSCDERRETGEIGAWREYAVGESGRAYICPQCSGFSGGGKRQKTK